MYADKNVRLLKHFAVTALRFLMETNIEQLDIITVAENSPALLSVHPAVP